MSGIVATSATFDSIGIASVLWTFSASISWSKKYQNGIGTSVQNMKLVVFPGNVKLISVCQDNNNAILVHIFNRANGSLLKKLKASAGLTRNPIIYDLNMLDASSLLIATIDNTAGVLLKVNIDDNTGTTYSDTVDTYYHGLSGKLSDNNIYLSGGNVSNQKQVLHKLKASHSVWWGQLLTGTTNFVFQEITNTDHDAVANTISFSTASTINFGTRTLISFGDTITVSAQKSLVFNPWTSATAQTIVGGTTGGTFTPDKLSCVTVTGMAAPSVAYSLVAGSGSVPSWTSIDSSTAQITYNSPTSASSETFSVRTVFGGNSATASDTSISVTVTEAPPAPAPVPAANPSTPEPSPTSASSGISGTSESTESGEKSCGITSGTGACIGAYVAIVVGGILVIGGLIFALLLITKYFVTTPTANTGSTAVPQTPRTQVGLKQTQEPIV